MSDSSQSQPSNDNQKVETNQTETTNTPVESEVQETVATPVNKAKKLLFWKILMKPNKWSPYYMQCLKDDPIRTKVITSALLSFFGNIISQTVFQKTKKRFNFMNLIRFTVFSGVLSPFSHHWFANLDRFVNMVFRKLPSSAKTIIKVILDQIIFAPFINVFFYSFMAIFSGKPHRILATIRSQLLPTLFTSWKVWPLAQAINFAVVPPNLRVLWNNIIGFFYGIYLSIRAAAV